VIAFVTAALGNRRKAGRLVEPGFRVSRRTAALMPCQTACSAEYICSYVHNFIFEIHSNECKGVVIRTRPNFRLSLMVKTFFEADLATYIL